MELIIDVQGFQSDGFIVKELAATYMEEDHKEVLLFKAPFPWNSLLQQNKTTCNWLTRNYHGIEWEDGEIDYDQIKEELVDIVARATVVYIKGLQKLNWIQEFIGKNLIIINVEDMGCAALHKLTATSNLKNICNNHHRTRNYNCALKNVIALKKWLLLYKENKIKD